MHDGAGAGRRKTDARIPSVQRGLSGQTSPQILSGFDQLPANIHHRFRPFLTGSGSQTECDVTYSKQTTEKFLTGARTHIKRSTFRTVFRHFSPEHFAGSAHLPAPFRSDSSTTRHLHQKEYLHAKPSLVHSRRYRWE